MVDWICYLTCLLILATLPRLTTSSGVPTIVGPIAYEHVGQIRYVSTYAEIKRKIQMPNYPGIVTRLEDAENNLKSSVCDQLSTSSVKLQNDEPYLWFYGHMTTSSSAGARCIAKGGVLPDAKTKEEITQIASILRKQRSQSVPVNIARVNDDFVFITDHTPVKAIYKDVIIQEPSGKVSRKTWDDAEANVKDFKHYNALIGWSDLYMVHRDYIKTYKPSAFVCDMQIAKRIHEKEQLLTQLRRHCDDTVTNIKQRRKRLISAVVEAIRPLDPYVAPSTVASWQHDEMTKRDIVTDNTTLNDDYRPLYFVNTKQPVNQSLIARDMDKRSPLKILKAASPMFSLIKMIHSSYQISKIQKEVKQLAVRITDQEVITQTLNKEMDIILDTVQDMKKSISDNTIAIHDLSKISSIEADTLNDVDTVDADLNRYRRIIADAVAQRASVDVISPKELNEIDGILAQQLMGASIVKNYQKFKVRIGKIHPDGFDIITRIPVIEASPHDLYRLYALPDLTTKTIPIIEHEFISLAHDKSTYVNLDNIAATNDLDVIERPSITKSTYSSECGVAQLISKQSQCSWRKYQGNHFLAKTSRGALYSVKTTTSVTVTCGQKFAHTAHLKDTGYIIVPNGCKATIHFPDYAETVYGPRGVIELQSEDLHKMASHWIHEFQDNIHRSTRTIEESMLSVKKDIELLKINVTQSVIDHAVKQFVNQKLVMIALIALVVIVIVLVIIPIILYLKYKDTYRIYTPFFKNLHQVFLDKSAEQQAVTAQKDDQKEDKRKKAPIPRSPYEKIYNEVSLAKLKDGETLAAPPNRE